MKGQQKVTIGLDDLIQEQRDLGNVEVKEDLKYILTRGRDGLVKKSKDIIWIEWNPDGSFKAKHEHPEEGRSLLMSPFTDCFTWQTTQIVEWDVEEGAITFRTQNSVYTLEKIKA